MNTSAIQLRKVFTKMKTTHSKMNDDFFAFLHLERLSPRLSNSVSDLQAGFVLFIFVLFSLFLSLFLCLFVCFPLSYFVFYFAFYFILFFFSFLFFFSNHFNLHLLQIQRKHSILFKIKSAPTFKNRFLTKKNRRMARSEWNRICRTNDINRECNLFANYAERMFGLE